MIRYKEFEDMDKALRDKTSWKNGAPDWNSLPFYFAKDFEFGADVLTEAFLDERNRIDYKTSDKSYLQSAKNIVDNYDFGDFIVRAIDLEIPMAIDPKNSKAYQRLLLAASTGYIEREMQNFTGENGDEARKDYVQYINEIRIALFMGMYSAALEVAA